MTKILQATQAACMPTFNAAAQGNASCRGFAEQMDGFLRNHKPGLVILSADWLEYSRPPQFDGMIADLRQTIAKLKSKACPWCCSAPPCNSDQAAVDADARASAAGRYRALMISCCRIFLRSTEDEGGAAGA